MPLRQLADARQLAFDQFEPNPKRNKNTDINVCIFI